MVFSKEYSQKISSTWFDCKVSFQDAVFLKQTGFISKLKQSQRNVVFFRLHFEIEYTVYIISFSKCSILFLSCPLSASWFEMFIEGTSLKRTNRTKQ